ncbi:HAMP domain-containing histidine kinase [Peptacetobacter hominis]|uniref:histidine kinase n=2 Tax=Peptacetobacter hominis TaxID=2743610 RepID=A0A544QT85_9FIRM|nr:HAMP domain-containing histidine kinase [Peptacetobacter hominis]
MECEVYQNMMIRVFSEIMKDKFFRRYLVISFLISLVFFILYLVLNNYIMEKISTSYFDKQASSIAEIIDKMPDNKDIIIGCIMNPDDNYKSEGKKILSNYGYEGEYLKQYNIDNINSLYKKYMCILAIIILFFNVLVLFIIFMVMKYTIKNLEIFYKKIEKIFNFSDDINSINEYKSENMNLEEHYNEGIMCRINMISDKANRNMRIHMLKINQEKENIKALVTDISHQLKTPLSNLKLYNTILIDEELNETERKDFLYTERQVIDKLDSLISSLINISRLEAGMINIKTARAELNNCLCRAIASIKTSAAKRNIDIINQLDKKYILDIDVKWTEEVIFNILDNAVKYSGNDKKVIISANETVNYVILDINDEGLGINKTEMNKIFKRFYRSSDKRIQKENGCGVGLYLARKIMNIQNGNIIVSSNSMSGSKFSIYFQKKGE